MKTRALGLALGLLACRHAVAPPSDRPAPPPHAPQALDVAASPDAAPAEDPLARRLSAMADELAERMAVVRGLAVRRPVARGVMSRAAVVDRLRRRTRAEYPPGELELEGETLKRLGLIPEAIDYERTMFDLLEEQVLGFYDPDEHRLYIADWVPAEMQTSTMAHEVTHALQDQHFDIGRFTHHVRGRGDAQTAAMAVVEGDATAAMFDFSLAPSGRTVLDLPDVTNSVAGQMSGSDQPRLAAAPRALRETLLFPYIAGLRLCVERMRAGGHGAIDALLAEAPASTEQVLHPDKLAAREAPVEVPTAVPAPLAASFELAYHDVLGEFGTRLVVADAVGEARAEAAAQGWGGDHALLLAPRGSVTPAAGAGVTLSAAALPGAALVWVSVLDAGRSQDDAEARELTAALTATLARRYAARPIVRVADATAARDVGGGRVSLVGTRGRTVVFFDRVPAESAAATLRALLPERAR
jgi:hypothetical protein